MSKISELTEATMLSDADMAVIDNPTDGSRKFKIKKLKDESDGNATDIGKLQDSMADEYDVNVSYSAGDYAMHEGTLYKATDTTTGAWDSSKWNEAQISGEISELNSNLTDLIKFKDYSCSYSITANGNLAITASDLSVSTPSGYTPLGFYLIATGNSNVIARNIYSRSTGSTTMVSVKNTSNSALNNLTLEISIAYIKSNFVGS